MFTEHMRSQSTHARMSIGHADEEDAAVGQKIHSGTCDQFFVKAKLGAIRLGGGGNGDGRVGRIPCVQDSSANQGPRLAIHE